MSRKLSIIVETDSYAGNFERDLTAYATGVVGDCEIGTDEAIDFIDKYGYSLGVIFDSSEIETSNLECVELVGQRVSDDYGTYRPCIIAKNNGGNHDNVEIFLERKPTVGEYSIIKERVEEFINKRKDIEFLGIKVVEKKTVVTEIELEV